MAQIDPHNLGELLARSRTADLQAFNDLLERLRSYLGVLVRSWLGPELAERLQDSDVVQDALLRISKSFSTFRGQSVPELLGWVERIARNATIDSRRKPERLQSEQVLGEVCARDQSPTEAALAREREFWLVGVLDKLAPSRRQVIEYRFIHNLPFAEIARRLQRSTGAVRVLFVRALDDVRRFLEETPLEP